MHHRVVQTTQARVRARKVRWSLGRRHNRFYLMVLDEKNYLSTLCTFNMKHWSVKIRVEESGVIQDFTLVEQPHRLIVMRTCVEDMRKFLKVVGHKYKDAVLLSLVQRMHRYTYYDKQIEWEVVGMIEWVYAYSCIRPAHSELFTTLFWRPARKSAGNAQKYGFSRVDVGYVCKYMQCSRPMEFKMPRVTVLFLRFTTIKIKNRYVFLWFVHKDISLSLYTKHCI